MKYLSFTELLELSVYSFVKTRKVFSHYFFRNVYVGGGDGSVDKILAMIPSSDAQNRSVVALPEIPALR